jgi:hypothetical protein
MLRQVTDADRYEALSDIMNEANVGQISVNIG